jgi:clan AA aspartic protease (TIGR02281 family)
MIVALLGGTAVAGPGEDAAAALGRRDYSTALRLFRPLADQGSANAQYAVGTMYYFGWGVPQDYAEAVKWWRKAAEQGDDDAQFALGRMYVKGSEVPQNYAEGLKWYRKAAEQGNALAQRYLGSVYYDGPEALKDSAEAMKWWRKAAEQGLAEAQAILGVQYADGKLVPQDYAEAVKWYRRAADQGDSDAQLALGAIYAVGRGVPRNYTEALTWYRKAADQGNATAQLQLGAMSFFGQGVPKNYAEALKWTRKAADQGDAGAQLKAGAMYHDGLGTPKDYVRAYMWFNLSASQGNNDAAKYRDQTAYIMTPAQIAEAQKLSRDWKPQSLQIARRGGEIASPTTAPNQNPSSRMRVALKADRGMFVVPVEINGAMMLDFTIDSGATDVSIPADVFSTLKRTGTLEDADIIGEQTYIMADGTKTILVTFMIRSLKIGNRVVENVKGSIAPTQGSLLLGQSFLGRFKSWSIDNTAHELLLEPR